MSPYAPGGTTDVLARLLAAKLQGVLGQSVIVENKSGAGGNIGTDYVAKAKPDGYTFLVASSGPLVIAPSLYPKLPYQPSADFTAVAPLASAAFVIAVNANSGLTSLKDVIARGKTGKLKVLAVTSARRSVAFPDIPTVSELGLKGFDAQPWYGLLGPAGVSTEIVDRMNREVRAILASTDVKARLFALGAEPMNMSPVDFKNYIAADTKKWSAVVKASGATVD